MRQLNIWKLAAFSLVFLGLTMSREGLAQEVIKPSETVSVEVDAGTLIKVEQDLAGIYVANPEKADVSLRSPQLIHVFGIDTGETTLYATDQEDNIVLSMRLVVTHNLSKLNNQIQVISPDAKATAVDDLIVLDGSVDNAEQAALIRELVERFLPQRGGGAQDYIDRMQVSSANQVFLSVRIAEVSRTVRRNFGIDWRAVGETAGIMLGFVSQGFVGSAANFLSNAQNGNMGHGSTGLAGFSIDSYLTALSAEGLVNILAEPTLTAISGETASFLAGGEFPIPTREDDTIVITYRQYGVSLSFTPTVLSSRRISMRVRPEVSELAEGITSVTLNGFVIPSINVRRADTTVELASGQTFVIGGLLQNTDSLVANKIPGLGDIPIIGDLFKSDNFRRNETELMIIVTPYLVNPISDPNAVALPTDATFGPEGSARLAQDRPTVHPTPQNPMAGASAGIAGPVGFILE